MRRAPGPRLSPGPAPPPEPASPTGERHGDGHSGRASPLDALLRRAGARMVDERGSIVAAEFGSIAGELAVCRRAVGIADRSDLVALELRARPTLIGEIVEPIAGGVPSLGVARRSGHAWWLARAGDRILVLCEPARRDELASALTALTSAADEVSCIDRSDDHAVLAVVGPRAQALLQALGPAEDVAAIVVAGVCELALGGCPALLLREASTQYLAVVASADAVGLWQALHEAGRELGAGCVGRHALEQFAISVRTLARQTAI